MKKYILYLVFFVIGAAAGMCLCRSFYHSRLEKAEKDKDTVYVTKTIRYSKEDLADKTTELTSQLPKYRWVFVPLEKTDTVTMEKKVYISLPRQNYFTQTEKAHIWHSGVDSTIDSLAVFETSATVTSTISEKAKRHSIGIGIEANYAAALNIPIQVEYSYMVNPWFSVYGFAEYELLRKQFGIGAGGKVQFGW